MMKSFFKKLAFVMALAMVVSMAAPAATTASAANDLKIAYQNGSAISEVNLAKVGDTEDLKFLGAPNWKELGVTWTSNNEAVATVDKAGVVTAISAGTAVIAVQIGSDVATVMVNVVDLPTYTATMGTTDDRNMTELTLEEEGDTFDLAFFGIKDYDKNRYNCNWYSVDESVATVDAKGLVTATGAGKTVISLGVYNVVTGKKHVVDSCEVVVGGAEPTATPTPEVNKDAFEVAQADTDKFVLDFEVAKTVEEIREGLTVSVKLGDKDYPISFENIAVEDKTVTVTTYAQFENGEVYTLTYGEETAEYTIVIGEIAAVGVTYYTGKNKDNVVAYVTEEEENDYVTLLPVLYDEYGNDITDKYNLNNFDFTYAVSSNVKPVQIYNDTFAFDKAGVATVDVTVAWVDDNGDYIEVAGKTFFDVIKRNGIGLTLEKSGIAATGNLQSDNLYTYIKSPKESFQKDANSAVWNSGEVNTSWEYRSETDKRDLVYTAVFKDNRGHMVASNNVNYQYGSFSYESTNSEVLMVEDFSGEVTLYKPGKANILVYFTEANGNGTKKLVGSTAITVTPEAYPVSYKILNASQTTASHVVGEEDSSRDDKVILDGITAITAKYDAKNVNKDLNDVKFKLQFYDQFGNVYDCARFGDVIKPAIKIEARDANNYVNYVSISWNENDKLYEIIYDGSLYDIDENLQKTYSYKVYLDDVDSTKTVKTAQTVFNLTIKNTLQETEELEAFIASTNEGTKAGTVGSKVKNYKFNISYSGGGNPCDVAVKSVIGYKAQWGRWFDVIKTQDSYWSNMEFKVQYLSTGNLKVANIPSFLLLEKGAATKGSMGYVYYKTSAPMYTTVAGKNVSNTGHYEYLKNTGLVQLKLNSATAGAFTYAGNGAYSVAFSTTRTEGGNLYNVKTSSVTANNSQTQGKYLGLNPEFEGLTELPMPTDEYDYGALTRLVEEQLLFSFDEVFMGDYYEDGDYWDYTTNGISIDWANSKYSVGTDSVTISTLAIVVTLDDNNAPWNDGTANEHVHKYTYTSMVPVGARIKAK